MKLAYALSLGLLAAVGVCNLHSPAPSASASASPSTSLHASDFFQVEPLYAPMVLNKGLNAEVGVHKPTMGNANRLAKRLSARGRATRAFTQYKPTSTSTSTSRNVITKVSSFLSFNSVSPSYFHSLPLYLSSRPHLYLSSSFPLFLSPSLLLSFSPFLPPTSLTLFFCSHYRN